LDTKTADKTKRRIMMYEEYMDALIKLREEAGTLEAMVDEMRERCAFEPHSIGTWGRVFRGERDLDYTLVVQIAKTTGMQKPEIPIEAAIERVKEWKIVGDRDKDDLNGVLVLGGGEIKYRESADESFDVQVLRPRRTTRRRVERKNIVLHLEVWKKLSRVKNRLPGTWDTFCTALYRLMIQHMDEFEGIMKEISEGT
jgi:hypothetical protein